MVGPEGAPRCTVFIAVRLFQVRIALKHTAFMSESRHEREALLYAVFSIQ